MWGLSGRVLRTRVRLPPPPPTVVTTDRLPAHAGRRFVPFPEDSVVTRLKHGVGWLAVLLGLAVLSLPALATGGGEGNPTPDKFRVHVDAEPGSDYMRIWIEVHGPIS